MAQKNPKQTDRFIQLPLDLGLALARVADLTELLLNTEADLHRTKQERGHLYAALMAERAQGEEVRAEFAAYQQRVKHERRGPENLTLVAENSLLRAELAQLYRERDAWKRGGLRTSGDPLWFTRPVYLRAHCPDARPVWGDQGDGARTAKVEGERMRATI